MSIRNVCVTSLEGSALTQSVVVGEHHLLADEPKDLGGDDRGPAPTEWLLAGLGACTCMTLQMYARNKKWELARVSVEVSGVADKGNTTITRKITVSGNFTAEQEERLLAIANKCPVHRILTGEISITSTLEIAADAG
jgi:putative redox protein